MGYKSEIIPGLQRNKMPWFQSWACAKKRCTNPKNNRYQYYGAKGIKFKLLFWETGWVYIRDKAYEMDRPEIHRLDSDGDYCLKNICFIEHNEHNRKTHLGRKNTEAAKQRMSQAHKGLCSGERNPFAKLTVKQVKIIRAFPTYIGSGVELAKRFNVTSAAISLVRRGKNWGSVCPS